MDKKAYYINRVSVAVLLLLFNLSIPNKLDLPILYEAIFQEKNYSMTSGCIEVDISVNITCSNRKTQD